MNKLVRSRFVEPLAALLGQGITPEKIAASLALGLTLGVFPALGTTTILCVAAATLFRLNFPAIQMANFIAYPLQLLFFIPFIRLGERAFGVAPRSITLAEVAGLIRADAWLAIHQLWSTTMHAIAVWAAISVPATVALYFLFLSLLRTLRSRREQFATRSEYLPQTPIGPDASSGGAA
jgi:uncharacterized protein (DUF2062 family)